MGRQALEVGELSKTVAKLLESARDEQGVSYRELQQRSGINRMRAQRILTEERPFTVDEVDEIAQALGLVGWKVVREAASMVSPMTDSLSMASSILWAMPWRASPSSTRALQLPAPYPDPIRTHSGP